MAETAEHQPTTTDRASAGRSPPRCARSPACSPPPIGDRVGQARRRAGGAIVDCGFYVAGERQPGDLDYAQALAGRPGTRGRLRLARPARARRSADLTDIAARLRAGRVRRRGRGQGRPAGQDRAVRRDDLPGRADHPLRRARRADRDQRDRRDRRPDDVHRAALRDHRPARRRRPRSAPIRAELESKPELLALGPVVGGLRDPRPGRRLLPRRRRPGRGRHRRGRAQVFARHVHGRIARIYQLKRELVEFKRAVVPLQRPLAALAEGRLGAMPKKITPLLPRRQRPPHPYGRAGRRPTTTCSTRSCRPGWPRSPSTRTTTCARSRRGPAIAAMQTAIAGIYGMNFDVHAGDSAGGTATRSILLVMFGVALGSTGCSAAPAGSSPSAAPGWARRVTRSRSRSVMERSPSRPAVLAAGSVIDCRVRCRARPWTRSRPLSAGHAVGRSVALDAASAARRRRTSRAASRRACRPGWRRSRPPRRRRRSTFVRRRPTSRRRTGRQSIGRSSGRTRPTAAGGAPAPGDHRPGGADGGTGREQARPAPATGSLAPASARSVAPCARWRHPPASARTSERRRPCVVAPAAAGGVAGPVVGRGDLLGRAAGHVPGGLPEVPVALGELVHELLLWVGARRCLRPNTSSTSVDRALTVSHPILDLSAIPAPTGMRRMAGCTYRGHAEHMRSATRG